MCSHPVRRHPQDGRSTAFDEGGQFGSDAFSQSGRAQRRKGRRIEANSASQHHLSHQKTPPETPSPAASDSAIAERSRAAKSDGTEKTAKPLARQRYRCVISSRNGVISIISMDIGNFFLPTLGKLI
jgi:hypothetical protein